jgi:hypothetical protein
MLAEAGNRDVRVLKKSPVPDETYKLIYLITRK